jgi:lipopolysaccharide export system protein LptA
MSTLKANIIDSTSATTEFKEQITANGDKQWVDSYGVIKTNRTTISENVTIPSGTNGLSSGPITIADTYEVTIEGEWVIV